MNHLKTGTAFFRQGSYKNNKYNSKELQETGMYSYGWRDYMPDIARWNGIDQLAENYLSTSTYAYVANNPVSYADVDGRWFNEDGTIDLSGHTPGFTTGHQYQTSFLGQYPGQGGGGYTFTGSAAGSFANGGAGGYTFTGSAAGSMFNYFANGGSIDGISFNNGKASWWTNTTEDSGILTNHNVKINNEIEWYGPAGKGNWFFGTAGVLSGFAGAVQSQHMYSQGIRRGISGNYQLTGRNLSQFGRIAMTDATIPISRIGKVGKVAGTASFYLGVAFDGIGVINYIDNPNSPNAVHPGKALLNTGFGIAGNWGGPIGASLSTVYFGVDNFYPGGWPGFFDNANNTQRELDEGFNQAGPARINLFGAHEPK